MTTKSSLFRCSALLKILSLSSALIVPPSGAFAQGKLDRVTLGYSACWRDAPCPVSEYGYDNLSYICRAFLQPLPDGSVGVPEGYFNPALESLAHQHGVKLLMSIGGGDAKAADWLTMATHPASLQKFLNQLGKLMTDNHYDGVDVDWEPSDPTKADGDAFGLFLKSLRAKYPQAVITTALPTDAYQTRFTPWPDVIASVNYINVMAYDYCGPWGGIAGHGSNLFPAGDYVSEPGHDVEAGMQNLLKTHSLPPSKLLMGMTFWGYRYRAAHLGGKFKPDAPNVSDALSSEQIQGLMASGHYQSLWDEKAAMPYLQRTGGGSVVAFENPDSIRRKCDFAKKLGCAGMMVWNLGSDMSASQTPLMDAMIESCGGHRHLLARAALEAEVTDTAQMIERDTQANTSPSAPPAPAPLPSPLSTLSVEQLESLDAQLQYQGGLANDSLWQQQGVAVASH